MSKSSALLGTFLLLLLAGFSLGSSGCNSDDSAATPASPIQTISVAGSTAFPDGTPLPNADMQVQLILDGANLFHPGPGGCTETPAHVAGTVIKTVKSGPDGRYQLSVPIQDLRAAVVRQCSIATLSPSQVEGLRIKATILADENSCATFCSATGDASADCVSSCAAGNRTIDAADSLGQELVTPMVNQAVSNDGKGTVQWSEPLQFAQLGPALATGPGPDLVVDAQAAQTSAAIDVENFDASSCEVAEACVRAPGNRRVLRFDGTIQNLGSSDLVIGSPASSPLFRNSSCHHVPLLSNIMLYELVDPATGTAVSVDGQQVVGRKQGFCMMDISQVNASAPQGQYNCNNQGITQGWADVYDSDLECQYLDITGVPAGNYTLRLTVNPDGIFQESDTSNNTAEISVAVPPMVGN